MPTYRYECQACGHELEVFQSMTARAKRKCPECGKPKLQRMIGAGAGVIFKGSGFYETDYRSASYAAGEKAATSEPKKDGTGKSSADTKTGDSSKSEGSSSSGSTGADKKKKS